MAKKNNIKDTTVLMKSLHTLELDYNAAIERINNTFYLCEAIRIDDLHKLREQFENDTQEAYKKAADDSIYLNNMK